MKTSWMAAALAASLWGAGALAQSAAPSPGSCNPTPSCVCGSNMAPRGQMRAQPQAQCAPAPSAQAPSGQAPSAFAAPSGQSPSTFAAPSACPQPSGSALAPRASTLPQQNQVAGSPSVAPGAMPAQQAPGPVVSESQQQQAVPPSEAGTGGAGEAGEVVAQPSRGKSFTGFNVMLGGGLEGFTGNLAPRVAPGPAYGVSIGYRPTNMLGLELDYSGSVHELRTSHTAGTDVANGADLVRNGGRFLATVGISATKVQPYLLAGVGLDRFSLRGDAGAFGYRDDTAGEVPVGAGIRAQFGGFTADLRGDYVVPFDQDFAPVHQTNSSNGRYQATLNIGGTF